MPVSMRGVKGLTQSDRKSIDALRIHISARFNSPNPKTVQKDVKTMESKLGMR
jgi:hypothetical protein